MKVMRPVMHWVPDRMCWLVGAHDEGLVAAAVLVPVEEPKKLVDEEEARDIIWRAMSALVEVD